jgi:hypothetical protein
VSSLVSRRSMLKARHGRLTSVDPASADRDDVSGIAPAPDAPALDEGAASLAEALSESVDDEERVRRIHFLVDEAYPPDPAVAQRQEPEEARLAVWSIVPHLDPVTFDRYWSALAHAASLESAFALDPSSTRWVWADAAELIVDESDFLDAEPADREGVGPGSVFRSEEYTDALREAWSQRRGAEVQALVAAERAARHPVVRHRTSRGA